MFKVVIILTSGVGYNEQIRDNKSASKRKYRISPHWLEENIRDANMAGVDISVQIHHESSEDEFAGLSEEQIGGRKIGDPVNIR